MTVKIFFSYNDKVIQLPVNPPELENMSPSANSKQEVINLGEVNILKTPRLFSLSIESFFPIYEDAPYVMARGKNFKSPKELTEFFAYAREKQIPVVMKITSKDMPGVNTGYLVSIEDFKTKVTGGELDLYYTMEISQYRNFGAKTFATDFNVPEDEEQKIKVAPKSNRFVNAYKKAAQTAKKVENGYRMVKRNADMAIQAVNTARTAGSIVKVVTNL